MVADYQRADTSDVVRFVQRLERSACARIGAGRPISDAVKPERWAKELTADSGCDPAAALTFVRAIACALTDAVGSHQKVATRPASAHLVFGYFIESIQRGLDPLREDLGDDSGTHMVYLLFDRRNELLYVGITDRGPTRLAEHYRRKPWFRFVCRVEFERYGTRAQSEAREKYLIHERAPLHNVQHNRGRHIA